MTVILFEANINILVNTKCSWKENFICMSPAPTSQCSDVCFYLRNNRKGRRFHCILFIFMIAYGLCVFKKDLISSRLK
jgi:hypothetical protein